MKSEEFATALLEGLMALLECGDFRKNGDIGYYADKLFVTWKVKSEE